MSEIHGCICGPSLYEFEGWFFELSGYGGPWPLKKDGSPRLHAGRTWWKVWDKFDALTDAEQQECHVGGGCQQF